MSLRRRSAAVRRSLIGIGEEIVNVAYDAPVDHAPREGVICKFHRRAFVSCVTLRIPAAASPKKVESYRRALVGRDIVGTYVSVSCDVGLRCRQLDRAIMCVADASAIK